MMPPAQHPNPPTPRRQLPGAWLLRPALLVVFGLLLVVAQCRAEPEPASRDTAPPTSITPSPPATPVPPPQPPTTAAADAAVLAAYTRFWEVYVAAASRSDPNHPELGQVATGLALEGLRLQLAGDRGAGLVGRGRPVRWATRLTRLTGQRAELTECLDSNQWLLYDAATAELRDAPSGIVRQVGAVLTHTSAGWKVAELDIGTTDVRETTCAR